jgi:hypothetical protein
MSSGPERCAALYPLIKAGCKPTTFLPDFQVIINKNINEGNRSVHGWYCQATYSALSPSIPVPPTGKQTIATGCHVFHWQMGKAAEAGQFRDWFGWLYYLPFSYH